MTATTATLAPSKLLPPAARRARRRSAALGLVAWVAGLGFCLPAMWMLLTSLHSEADAATNPPRSRRRSPSTTTGSSSAPTAVRAPGLR